MITVRWEDRVATFNVAHTPEPLDVLYMAGQGWFGWRVR